MPFCKTDKKIKKIMATLQVPIKLKACKRVSLRASLSIETAVVLPVFIFFMISMIDIFSVLNLYRKVYAVSESICKETGKYMYLSDKAINDELSIKKDIIGKISEFAVEKKTLMKLKENGTEKGMKNLNIKCTFSDNKEFVDLKIEYDYILPFSIFGVSKVEQSVISKIRAYIGKYKRGKDVNNNENTDEEVYVGRYSTRYHKNRYCHYLYNNIRDISYRELLAIRNVSGGKYYSCKRCIKGSVKYDTVFVLPNGSAYHSSKACTAILSYIEKVKKSEVIHKGACSYCGGVL